MTFLQKTILILVLPGILNTYAQDSTQTLFKLSKIKTMGLYIAPEFQMADLNQHAEPFRAFSAMLQFNAHLSLGYSFFNSVDPMIHYRYKTMLRAPISLSAGAIKIEYALKPKSKIHISFPLLIGRSIAQAGYGVMPLAEKSIGYPDSLGNLPYLPDYYLYGQSRYAIIQPGITIEANVFKVIKLYLGVQYRFSLPLRTAYDDHMYIMAPEALHPKFISGLVLNSGIKIGLFEKPIKRK